MAEIYLITNSVNLKQYVGKTYRTAQFRFAEHVFRAIRGDIDTIFAKAIRKYGPEKFIVETLETTNNDILSEREKFYISKIKPEYNMTDGGDGGQTGMKNSKWINNGVESYRLRCNEELPDGYSFGRLNTTKEKMRRPHAKISKEGCDNMRLARLKFRHTDEAKIRMSAIRKEIWRQKKALPHP